jgi:hypothetical protein
MVILINYLSLFGEKLRWTILALSHSPRSVQQQDDSEREENQHFLALVHQLRMNLFHLDHLDEMIIY